MEECRRYDDDECGIQYSDADQAFFCEVEEPIVWPPSISIPKRSDRARAWAPSVVFFIHADDKSVERVMQDRMLREMSVEGPEIGDEVGFFLVSFFEACGTGESSTHRRSFRIVWSDLR